MAERLNLEPEVQDILKCIDKGNNFLLSGGAGSGKTYSLVQVIKQIIEENIHTNIACITYTNAAVKEIEDRVDNKKLFVSTIHEFLWSNINNYQNELKLAIVDLINQEEPKIRNTYDRLITKEMLDKIEFGIQYKEYLRIQDGIISHDEVLIIANYMFEKYPLLSDILKDKFKFIFIDEYQDTADSVIEIFLKHINQSNRKNVIGLFGDSMQSIYDAGIGDVNNYTGNGENSTLIEVPKTQNRRCPQAVIDLANKLRTDDLEQVPSNDNNAPNMIDEKVKDGTAKFYYSNNASDNIDILKDKIGWDFDDSKQTKILNLTHNLIAPKAGFENLMEIYNGDKILDFKKRLKDYIKNNQIEKDFSDYNFGQVIEYLQDLETNTKVRPTPRMQEYIDFNQELYEFAKKQNYASFSKMYIDKDQLLDDKKNDIDGENKSKSNRDNLIRHLVKIQDTINLYENEDYNEFIRVTDYRIRSIQDKITLKANIEELTKGNDYTIEKMIEKADELGICKKDDKIIDFINKKEYIFYRVKKLKFSEFSNLYNYLKGYTPFSTQHKTKGAEFDNVLVILDNGGWNNYNFKKYFDGENSESVEKRTAKILYVCCTRAKENLAVYFNNPSSGIIKKAIELFGEENIRKFGNDVQL